MKVHPSHTDELAPAATAKRAARSATTSGASFASLHATAVAASTAKSTTPGSDVAGKVTGVEVSDTPKQIKLRKGEAMTPVAGHAYAEITSGKRDGMYVNTTNNRRRGQAFVLAYKNGREYHIYGTGKDRVVVALKRRKAATPPASQPAAAAPTTPTVSATGTTGGVTSA